ncbi:MAG: UDP-diphosphatase [Deltaproteobacteria bacterium HGW-Deltaproteobacteria-17]|nr:MAG: UDP-diphosphatase [Deltaproteobacteria bacterium HGW-Deltaproteobacteria-17]
MGPLLLFLLGLLQGLTEFLPVSSSGHLVLVERLMDVHPSLAVNVGLHAGSLAAILFYYRVDLVETIRAMLPGPGADPDRTAEHRQLAWHLILATLVTVPMAILLRDPIEGWFAEPAAGRFLGLTFLVTAIVLVLSEWTAADRPPKNLTWKGALLIGLVQGVAVFPGISRSGATIAAALILGLSSEKAARFSFLLAIPVIGGASLLELPDLFGQMNVWHLLLGMAASILAGLAALSLLVGLIRARRFAWFAAYLTPLAAFCLIFNP